MDSTFSLIRRRALLSQRFVWSAALVLLCGLSNQCFGQGTLEIGPTVVLRTGAGQTLTTITQPLAMSTAPGMRLRFAFGFATEEVAAPDVFLDSATVTLQDTSSSLTAVFVTTDGSGTYWAPAAPEAILLDPNSIQWEPVPFPDMTPNHARQFSYVVTTPIPTKFAGRQANLFLDLFDNQNTMPSRAWVNTAAVVPEPTTWLFLLVGLLFIFGFMWRTE